MKMEYKTTDIILAAVLRLQCYQMNRIDITGNMGTFVFDPIPDEVIMDYDLGNVLVEPTSFNAMIKQLTTSVRRMTSR
jgi:hypothetical protein